MTSSFRFANILARVLPKAGLPEHITAPHELRLRQDVTFHRSLDFGVYGSCFQRKFRERVNQGSGSYMSQS